MHRPSLTVIGCMVLLELGIRFEMPGAVERAESELGFRAVPPLLRLQYGLLCQRPTWVDRAFYKLMEAPLYTATNLEKALITPAIYYHIAETRNLCNDYRYQVYANVPAVIHVQCTDQDMCTHAWQLAWCKGFSRLYLCPDPANHMFFSSAEDELRQAVIPNMGLQCLDRTRTAVLNSGLFSKEIGIIDRGIAQLADIPIVNKNDTISEGDLFDGPPALAALATLFASQS